ncbi:MAG: ATP-dependent DNA helicase [Gammaproteobacteria bacterium]|nr:ATP-dependent DNA helicase [Gammaproteobacteria bacterium]
MKTAAELLGQDGPLAAELPGFAPRPQQQRMTEAVETALHQQSTLLVEAGTGTGKTFAYLLPALLSGHKTLVSTGTRNLQDQIFRRDLPELRKYLGSSARIALLKGRSNYLCRYRLDRTLATGGDLAPDLRVDLGKLQRQSAQSGDGDTGQFTAIAEESPLWGLVTSTTDNCLGHECPQFDECYLIEARRQAQEADLVVVNHHLLMADLALREEGFGSILPDSDAIVFDEAHELPEIARQFFGTALSARQINGLAQDAINEAATSAPEQSAIVGAARELTRSTAAFRQLLPTDTARLPWHAAGAAKLTQGLEQLAEAVLKMKTALLPVADRSKGLDQCKDRCERQLSRLSEFMEEPEEARVLWLETFRRTFTLHTTPLDIANSFSNALGDRPRGLIFTSATLAHDGQFAHFTNELGLTPGESLCLDTPFDYLNNSLLFLPENMPDPNDLGYDNAVVEAALPVLRASQGRAFLLFTSHRALRQSAAQLAAADLPYPLLVQGELPRDRLLVKFRETPNAILLGTSSFWQGVDVKGEALSCVIIAKLPFAMPDDPVLQARIQQLKKQGRNAFGELQLPTATTALKQGAGRLIRDSGDRGVLMICDPRLRSRSYGRIFLKNLPKMPITRDPDDVTRFFDE